MGADHMFMVIVGLGHHSTTKW